ncbi:hypothetical protein [Pandoraea sputorum]|uniref:Uncharacterized protein n=1 Tax=Pandoraea sputorum TaxID=93222 RepID=A0A5E5BLS3_9BURK|nr:hypothetical protein [Pandoraea sputorum]VVE86005.1 hypothetical protein PSP31121_05644 [Pandoraea sputorum]
MHFFAASSPRHEQLFRTILSAPLTFGGVDQLAERCAYLARRYLGEAGRPPEALSISGVGDARPTIIDFTSIRDAPLPPEERGPAVLALIAGCLVPALQRQGADAQAAQSAAMHMVAQLGNPEFATLAPSAVQGAIGPRMRGEPLSTTHIALAAHGEVLVHTTTQWASYVDDTGQPRGFGSQGPPVLTMDVVTGFWLERTRAGRGVEQVGWVFANAEGTKQFVLHGKVQRCLLETPAADLKALLVPRTPTLLDILLYGLARLLGQDGIFIDPPSPLENTLWDMTRPALPTCPPLDHEVVPPAPPRLLTATARRVQASHAGVTERNAALAFGAYCQSRVRQLIPCSYSQTLVRADRAHGIARDQWLAQAEWYGVILDTVRDQSNTTTSAAQRSVTLLKKALACATGDCEEMALVAAALAQTTAKSFLAERGLARADIRAEIFEAKREGDHAFCVVHLKIHGATYTIAIDPWAEVAMPYEHYVDYMTTYQTSFYINTTTTFGVDAVTSKAINQPTFMREAGLTLQRYVAPPERTGQPLGERNRLATPRR